MYTTKLMDIKKPSISRGLWVWEHTGSNRGPPACKAGALNQLSYAPFFKELNFPIQTRTATLPIINRDALNQLSYAPFLKNFLCSPIA